MQKLIKIANIIIKTDLEYQTDYETFTDYYIDDTCIVPDLNIIITKEDLIYEKQKSFFVTDTHERFMHPFKISDLERLAFQRKLSNELLRFETLLMHGVLLAVDNKGYIITAKSGVGKTTRALQWVDAIPNTYIVNGDKPFITITDKVIGYGSPWCGKEGYNRNTDVEIKGICFLSRSDETIINEITFSDAFSKLINQIYIPENETGNVIQLLKKMSKYVKYYDLKCDTSKEAALQTFAYIKSCEK